MIPRSDLERLLNMRLHTVLSWPQLERLLAEIKKLEGKWEEMNPTNLKTDSCGAVSCLDCWLEEQQKQGSAVKLFFKSARLVSQSRVL